MSMFDFNESAKVSSSNVGNQLPGNEIHTVKFDGCEARTIDSANYNGEVLDIKFSNEHGTFTHTIFEPRESDAEDRDGQFGKQPSNVKAMMMLINHLIKAVNPTLFAQIESGEKKIAAKSWKQLREIVIKATEAGKGTETQIKLIKNNKGYGAFPSFFANYNRDGELYMNTNFIGKNLSFTTKEMNRMKKATDAKPTTTAGLDLDVSTKKGSEDNDLDLNLDF